MTVRKWPWPQTGGAARWVRGLLVTLCAVVAVLLHHELAGSPVTTMSMATPHAMSGPVSVPAAHPHMGSPPSTGAMAHGPDGAACPSMAMQLCAAAGVDAVQLTAPPESPAPTVPARIAELTGVDIARSVNRAPPDLSLLSQLRI
ncbi:DUF6153 family protein [Streptomyces sp. NPDC050263]|uniref:DUF6153 family protein n=1 Tax=Streptomyces sp. NPDC050263 TaxID=3155037 RepID=UPI003433B79C